jgi:ComF family protein
MSIRSHARDACRALVDLFYPPHCVECGVKTDAAAAKWICGACAESAPRIQAPFCDVCSRPFDGEIRGTFRCPNCVDRRFHFTHAVAAYRSRGVVRHLIHRFKYERQYHLRHILGDWLVDSLASDRITRESFDAFVPVPLHPARQREREFNQAGVLARILADRTGHPVLDCLRRVRNTETQTHFDREERMENLRNAFELRNTSSVHEKRLLLIDDVLTTGSTLDECARILRAAGSESVRAVVVARG